MMTSPGHFDILAASRKRGGFSVFSGQSATELDSQLATLLGCLDSALTEPPASSTVAGIQAVQQGFFLPACELAAKFISGGSIMKIRFRQVPSKRDETLLVVTKCDLCLGHFAVGLELNVAYKQGDDGQSEDIGFACDPCAVAAPETLSLILEARSYDLDYDSYHQDCRSQEYYLMADSLAAGRPMTVREMLLQMSETAQGWSVKFNTQADELRLLADAEIYPLRSNQNRPRDVSAGYVYLLGSPEGYCKIGRTRNLSTRLLAIGLQLPFRVEMLHSISVSDPVWAERFLHQRFASCRMNGEWFLLSDSDIQWIKALATLEPGDGD